MVQGGGGGGKKNFFNIFFDAIGGGGGIFCVESTQNYNYQSFRTPPNTNYLPLF